MLIRQLGATIGTKRMAGTTSMIAGLSLPIPLFDANRGEVQRASAERDAAAFELANQERMASAEVVGAFEAARLLTDRARVLTRGGPDNYLARAEEARRIALGAYREGAVPLFQVIDAARTWGDARLTYYRTLYAQHQSVIALLAAEGSDLFAPTLMATLGEPAP
jgi:cobalt-zinc-cadmium efflux system outer membrane protein